MEVEIMTNQQIKQPVYEGTFQPDIEGIKDLSGREYFPYILTA
jgi:hypothetical protein